MEVGLGAGQLKVFLTDCGGWSIHVREFCVMLIADDENGKNEDETNRQPPLAFIRAHLNH